MASSHANMVAFALILVTVITCLLVSAKADGLFDIKVCWPYRDIGWKFKLFLKFHKIIKHYRRCTFKKEFRCKGWWRNTEFVGRCHLDELYTGWPKK